LESNRSGAWAVLSCSRPLIRRAQDYGGARGRVCKGSAFTDTTSLQAQPVRRGLARKVTGLGEKRWKRATQRVDRDLVRESANRRGVGTTNGRRPRRPRETTAGLHGCLRDSVQLLACTACNARQCPASAARSASRRGGVSDKSLNGSRRAKCLLDGEATTARSRHRRETPCRKAVDQMSYCSSFANSTTDTDTDGLRWFLPGNTMP
jgi:hypothetical protein